MNNPVFNVYVFTILSINILWQSIYWFDLKMHLRICPSSFSNKKNKIDFVKYAHSDRKSDDWYLNDSKVMGMHMKHRLKKADDKSRDSN